MSINSCLNANYNAEFIIVLLIFLCNYLQQICESTDNLCVALSGLLAVTKGLEILVF